MVYLIQNTVSLLCKIGSSAKPKSRLSQLQVSCVEELALLEVMEGGIREEKALHKQFADDRVRGEWFNYSALLREVFRRGAVELPAEVKRPAKKELTYLLAMGRRGRKTKCRLNVTGLSQTLINAQIEHIKTKLPDFQHNFYLQASGELLKEILPGDPDPDYRGKYVGITQLYMADKEGNEIKVDSPPEKAAQFFAQKAYDKRYKAIMRDNPPNDTVQPDTSRFMRPA